MLTVKSASEMFRVSAGDTLVSAPAQQAKTPLQPQWLRNQWQQQFNSGVNARSGKPLSNRQKKDLQRKIQEWDARVSAGEKPGATQPQINQTINDVSGANYPETATTTQTATPETGASGQQQFLPGMNPGEFQQDDELRLVPDEQEVQQGTAAIDQLERDYHQILQHASALSKQMKQDFDAWRPLYDTFNSMRPAWKNFRQQLRSDPNLINRLSPQSIQAAQQAMQQTLPMAAQMMAEQRQDAIQVSQFMQSAHAALQAIQSLVNASTGGTQAAYKPRLTALSATACKMFRV